jgi:hypothetical protein
VPAITIDQSNVSAQEDTAITFTGTATNMTAVRLEIGRGTSQNFANADNVYDSVSTSVSGGTWSVTVPSTRLDAGTYTVVIGGIQGSGIGVQDQAALTVTPALPAIWITSSSVSAGGSVSVSWSNVHTSASSWIALFKKGDPFTYDSLRTTQWTWVYLNCTKTLGNSPPSGTCPFALPSTLPNGTYVFELFGDDTYTNPITQSSTLTVTSNTSASAATRYGLPASVLTAIEGVLQKMKAAGL